MMINKLKLYFITFSIASCYIIKFSIHRKEVLKEYETIQHGIGMPDLYLAICLAAAWIVIVSVLIGGVQSSGKASYFLGIVFYWIKFDQLYR